MRSSGNGHYENLRLINPVIPVILLSMNYIIWVLTANIKNII